jgi:hypothetical protein
VLSYGVDLSHAAPGWIEYYAPLQNSWELRRRHYASSHAAASLGRLVAVTEAELLQKIAHVILSDGFALHMAAPSHTPVDVSAPSYLVERRGSQLLHESPAAVKQNKVFLSWSCYWTSVPCGPKASVNVPVSTLVGTQASVCLFGNFEGKIAEG